MSTPPILSGPIPPYSNPPITPQYYKPSRFVISNVTLGSTTIITTSVDNNYVVGQEVRLIIPPGYGCTQLTNQAGYVISLPASNQVEIDINSIFANQFISASTNQSPQIVAIGDINSGQININGLNNQLTYIPGSFQDISPV